jgi:uncharacterized membrane protein
LPPQLLHPPAAALANDVLAPATHGTVNGKPRERPIRHMAQEPTRLGLPRREAAWLATAAAAVVVLGGGAIALPRLVWDRFLWQYFWGPVFADANNVACAVRVPGSAPELLGSDAACASAAAGRIVAYPGYTVVSEIGYAVTLIFMLLGVLFLLQHLEVGHERGFFFALTPFVFLGGALRVVEDANDAAAPTPLGQVIDWPLNALIISPVIYFTMFVFTLAALVVASFTATTSAASVKTNIVK